MHCCPSSLAKSTAMNLVWAIAGRVKLTGEWIRWVRLQDAHPRACDVCFGVRVLLIQSHPLRRVGLSLGMVTYNRLCGNQIHNAPLPYNTGRDLDRKSTRLNSSHSQISYA